MKRQDPKRSRVQLNICYSSMRFYGEPLVMSCERTVSVGGGLVKDAGMVSTRVRDAALHCSYVNRPPQTSGRAQDITRGGPRDSVLHRAIESPACLWQISRCSKEKLKKYKI